MVLRLRDPRGLPIVTENDGLVIEIGHIEYNGNIAKVYIPKRFVEALKLDKNNDKAYLMIRNGKSITFIRDDELIEKLKPLIYAARKAHEKLKKRLK